jgi:hypothetical protein
MAHDAYLATKGYEIPKFRAPGDTGLGHDDAMPSDHHVVPDLHEIINFRALPDHGIPQGASVDGGVGADLHPVLDDHAADLRHLRVPCLAHGEAKSVLADGHSGMKRDIVADEGVGHRGIRANIAAASDMDPVADDRACSNCGTSSHSRFWPDDGARLHDHSGFKRCAWVDR